MQLTREDPSIAAHISENRNIIAFRNILVHAYAQIDNRIVWEVVEYKLPVLLREVSALMEQADPEP